MIETLIQGGYVISMDEGIGTLAEGDVLVRGREIAAVGKDLPAKIYARDKLRAGDRIPGPAIVTEMDSTTLILPGHGPPSSIRVGARWSVGSSTIAIASAPNASPEASSVLVAFALPSSINS